MGCFRQGNHEHLRQLHKQDTQGDGRVPVPKYEGSIEHEYSNEKRNSRF